jgi:hypothetical protein
MNHCIAVFEASSEVQTSPVSCEPTFFPDVDTDVDIIGWVELPVLPRLSVYPQAQA